MKCDNDNLTDNPACGDETVVMVTDVLSRREKKLNEAFRKGLRCGAKVKDTLGSVIDHWFFDSDNTLLCSLKSPAGSGSLSFSQLKLTGENAYRRLDGAETNPELPKWLSPKGWLKGEPKTATKKIERKDRTWFVTIYFEFPFYSAYVVSESEGICFCFKSMQSLEEHLQKVLTDNRIDPKKTYGYGFRFEPDMFDCRVIIRE